MKYFIIIPVFFTTLLLASSAPPKDLKKLVNSLTRKRKKFSLAHKKKLESLARKLNKIEFSQEQKEEGYNDLLQALEIVLNNNENSLPKNIRNHIAKQWLRIKNFYPESGCSKVRLDQDGSAQKTIVTDQGQVNSCYAHASTTVLSSYIYQNSSAKEKKSFSSNNLVSPVGLALNVCEIDYDKLVGKNVKGFDDYIPVDDKGNRGEGRLDYNSFCNTINVTLKKGYYSREDLENRLYEEGGQDFLEEIRDIYKEEDSNEQIEGLERCETNFNFFKFLSNKSKVDLRKVFNIENPFRFYRELFKTAGDKKKTRNVKLRALKNSKKIKCSEMRAASSDDQYFLAFKLHSKLQEKNALPVSAGYCSRLLTKGKSYKGFTPNGNYDVPADCDLHLSAIVGREYNSTTKTCDYVVQNSWGESCAKYHADFFDNCEDGKIKVSEQSFLKSLDHVGYIEKK